MHTSSEKTLIPVSKLCKICVLVIVTCKKYNSAHFFLADGSPFRYRIVLTSQTNKSTIHKIRLVQARLRFNNCNVFLTILEGRNVRCRTHADGH